MRVWTYRNFKHPSPMKRMSATLTLFLLLQLNACNTAPPHVESARDIAHVRKSKQYVTASLLPDKDVPALARLRQLYHLDFTGSLSLEPPITDEGLRRLSELDLPQLGWLSLGYCDNITDAGLLHVAHIQTLTRLNLMVCPQITDAGLLALLEMNNLIYLDLRGRAGITDQGLEYLARKSNWDEIHFGGCKNVTMEAVVKLQAALPNTSINKDEKEWSYHLRDGDA